MLLRLKPAGERDLINRIKMLAPVVQGKDTALVLDGQAEIAARAGADGAHLTGIEAFMAAVESLKPARIAGCGGLKTRDEAMAAGERGADYVMFGETDAQGRRPSFEAIIERIEWWAELFTIPCVGFAASPSRRSARSWPPAPISSRSATASGTIRAAPRRACGSRTAACSRRRPAA